MHAKLHRL